MREKKRINQIEPFIEKKDADNVYKYLLSGGWVTEHSVTAQFEDLLKSHVDRKYAIAVPSGTIAIYLSLLSSGIKKGNRVAVPNLTMIATINAVIWAGAEPVLIDVDEAMCMSYDKLKSFNDIDAVIYVPLNGRTENGLDIEKWCKKNKIILIEDSAHALGSEYENKKKCGKLGDASILSLTPHKIITTGQGGVLLTDSSKIYKEAIKLKTFNRRKDKLDWHDGYGLNFKFTDLQASLGISQLQTLENRIKKKRELLNNYKKIENQNIKVGEFLDYEVPWFFDVIGKSKNIIKKISSIFNDENIEIRNLYPALSKQKYLKNVIKTDLSISEAIFDKVIWLPSSINIAEKDQLRIIKLINRNG